LALEPFGSFGNMAARAVILNFVIIFKLNRELVIVNKRSRQVVVRDILIFRQYGGYAR
jgi:hypothetical protein